MAGLHFLSRNSAGGLNIIGRHPPDSGTWTWCLSVRFGRHDQRLGPFAIPHKLRFGNCRLTLPFLDFRLQRQEATPRLTPEQLRQRILDRVTQDVCDGG